MSESAAGVPTCYRHPDRETYVRCQRCDKAICPDCMREASVGFQCPDCVKEGARSVRQPRAAYGGQRSTDPQRTSMVLVGLNVLVWLAIVATGWATSSLLARLALLPAGSCRDADDTGIRYPNAITEQFCSQVAGTAWYPGVSDGAVWQLLTSVFTHENLLHIGFNMMALWFLGPQVEAVLGRARFLALYLVAGLAGSVCVYWFSGEHTATLGASGAVFGLMGALVVVIHKVGGNLQSIGGWLLINGAITFLVPGISWQGHLGGFLGGLAVTAVLVYAPKDRRTLVQVLGVGLIALLLVVATIGRTVVLA
ncbi:rhomboid family intramembrane serine protease [Nocardioides stalactiti]|uniref:rhomboid family intramembrane serine protease n=1 Tax=Nocardioides stalactiti TaxID=2755356 RepID=UPI001602998B|nr:rhomboid family intramembrane serine protease [Nocardioides stalactiti]